eukprot:456388_1
MDSSNNNFGSKASKNNMKSSLLTAWLQYGDTHLSDLQEYTKRTFTQNSVHGCYRNWFKTNKIRTKQRKLNEFRKTLTHKIRDLLVCTDATDLSIKASQSIGEWWSHLQSRVLSPHMWKKALKNKGKRSKTKLTSINKTRQNKRKQTTDDNPTASKRRKISTVQVAATNPRIGNKPRSPFAPEYIEKFATSLSRTKVHVSCIHETTRQINSIQFETDKLTDEEQRILDTPKACAGREQLIIYSQYINDRIHVVFDKYNSTPISISIDTGSHKHRQKENMYDTVYYWNVEPDLITKACKQIDCK